MSNLQRAIEIALAAHADQFDKAGALYILHPLRVMLAQTTEKARIVAVLHDVVEDCEDWSLDRLRAEGFSEEIVSAIDAVTKRPGEEDDYDKFIERGSRNALAREVKLADLRDNSDLSRLANPTEKDRARVARYQKAIRYLSNISNT
ncbi:MAG: GTP pyrophosphokinase [Devosia sp.]